MIQFDLQPNIRERNPVVKRDPTVLVCVLLQCEVNRLFSGNLIFLNSQRKQIFHFI